MNLFCTILTHEAPSSNYRGENEENRSVLQTISRKGSSYAVISPEAIRNGMRERLALLGLPCNRRRLLNEGQPAVELQDFPDAARFADDFLFGYLVADAKAMGNRGPAKRDSVIRVNMAVATSPFQHESTFHQSPLHAGESPWKNANTSMLLHKEVTHTAFQYPFALAGRDCCASEQGKIWAKTLISSLGELSGVAGGHARSYFEFAPRSLVACLTPRLAAGYGLYGFNEAGEFPELNRVHPQDLEPEEFWIAGEVARKLSPADRKRLETLGAHVLDNPQKALTHLASAFLGRE